MSYKEVKYSEQFLALARICLSANHRDLNITLADSDSVGTHFCVLDASKLFELASANIQQFRLSFIENLLGSVDYRYIYHIQS